MNEARAHGAGSGAAYASICTDDAMRRHEEIELARRHCCRNRPMCRGTPNGASDVGIRNKLAKTQGCNGAPRFDAQVGSFKK